MRVIFYESREGGMRGLGICPYDMWEGIASKKLYRMLLSEEDDDWVLSLMDSAKTEPEYFKKQILDALKDEQTTYLS